MKFSSHASGIPGDSSSANTIYSVAEVRDIDHAAIHGAGIDGYTLMTRAAEAALQYALDRFPDARRWQVLGGGGNNAGDGYVLARLAAERNIDVSLLALVDPATLKGDALTASAGFLGSGGTAEPWSGVIDPDADLIIDALLGSGLERDVGGGFADAVAAMNAHIAPVLALDIPTGLHGDSGAVMGCAVRAQATVTFVGLKTGLFMREGPAHVGDLHFADLDIPEECRQTQRGVLRRLTGERAGSLLPPRDHNAHKGDFGHLLIVGGGPGMPGAVRLAGEAALRSGAGMVSIATHPSHLAAIMAGRPELMCHGVSAAEDLSELLGSVSTVALGPGLGRSAWALDLFEAVIATPLPLILDADALNLLADHPQRNEDWILTPHPGEAGRLLGISSAAVQADRLQALERLQERYAGTAVLKGMGTLTSSSSGLPWLCTDGNPGMASPGMGDVLSGIVASLRAQGLVAEMAAALGVRIHARAGDRAAADGERGLLASDLIAELRPQVNRR